jgi:uncharacterized RmlC-like cupin family protein
MEYRSAHLVAAFAACALAQQPGPVTFGTTVVVPGGFRGVLYYLKPGTNHLPDFKSLKPIGAIYAARLDVPPQTFLAGFPGVTNRFEWFAIDYTARFWIESPDAYRFAITSDDGAKLWIDDHLVIDNDGIHPPRDADGEIDLARGVHRIRVAYFQGPRLEVALVLKVARAKNTLRVFNTEDFKPPPDTPVDEQIGETEIDNEFARVTRTLLSPHDKTPIHAHALNHVAVYLDDAHIETRFENGRVEKRHFSAGEAVWNPAEAPNTNENIGDKPARIIEIELKKTAPSAPQSPAPDLDPVAIDRKHNHLLFENRQVRVFKSWREPHTSEMLHEHVGAGRVAIYLTDIDAIIRANGDESDLHAAAGAVSWSGPAKHAARNTGDKKYEMIVVEVK